MEKSNDGALLDVFMPVMIGSEICNLRVDLS